MSCAIFYLTQNTELRKVYLKTSLYFLFRNFNSFYNYPVIILHENDYDELSKREIIMSIRSSHRSLITFQELDKDDFKLPDNIDEERLKLCVDIKLTSYWRNEKYRIMCRWWLVHFPKYSKNYEYVMRLDDDSIIEEPIQDLFKLMNEKKLVYSSNIRMIDCALCCYGMKEFFSNLFNDEESLKKIDTTFIKQYINIDKFVVFMKFLSINKKALPLRVPPELPLRVPPELPFSYENFVLDTPVMYYNNFFITKTSFWEKPDVKKTIEQIDRDGSIFYYRWGDSPLQSLIVLLLAKESEVETFKFKYSKRMEREAFYGNDKMYYSYMPLTYT
jgi:hypothetical protein